MNKNIDSYFAIAIIALVSACVAIAFWSSEEIISMPTVENYVLPVRSVDAVKKYTSAEMDGFLDPSTWIEYVNNQIGISFKYPKGLGGVGDWGGYCMDDDPICYSHIGLTFDDVGIFLATMNRYAHENPPARGGYFGDFSGNIESEAFVKNFCVSKNSSKSGGVRECSNFVTKNGNSVATFKTTLPYSSSGELMDVYYLHSPRSVYYGIAVSNRGFLSSADALEVGLNEANSEEIMRKIVESIQFIPTRKWMKSGEGYVSVNHPEDWRWLDEEDRVSLGFNLASPNDEVVMAFHRNPLSQEKSFYDFDGGERERLVGERFEYFADSDECRVFKFNHQNFKKGEILFCDEELSSTYYIASRGTLHTIYTKYKDGHIQKQYEGIVGQIMRSFSSTLDI